MQELNTEIWFSESAYAIAAEFCGVSYSTEVIRYPKYRKSNTKNRNLWYNGTAGIFLRQDHHYGGGCPLRSGEVAAPSKTIYFAKEVVTMIDINTVIAVITLVITAVGFGLQLASYINTKNNRPTSSKL